MSNSELGRLAEYYATHYLTNKGYEILDNNYRKPWGEIDIIARKEGILVFVEVKANKKYLSGFEPELRADWSKMSKVYRTAKTYLANKKFDTNQIWQIDILSVTFNEDRGVAKIKHFKNTDI